jgi:hypothetical protein
MTGHLPKDCPKDPNIRSKGVINEELERINMLRRRRQARVNTKTEPDYAKTTGTRGDESEDSARELEEEKEGFDDIEKMKEVLAIHTDIVRPT